MSPTNDDAAKRTKLKEGNTGASIILRPSFNRQPQAYAKQ